jgi:hypothetical protein
LTSGEPMTRAGRAGAKRLTDRLVSYDGQVRLTVDGRKVVFDVAGMLYARSQGEAAWAVTDQLRDEIKRATRHDATEAEPGWPDE